MKTPIITAAIFLAATGFGQAAEEPAEQLKSSVMVEWAFAHCNQDLIPGMLFMGTMAVINATEPEEVIAARKEFREIVKENYPDRAATCRDMEDRISQSQHAGN